MTKDEAAQWVKQELAKVDSLAAAQSHLKAYANSKPFFESAGGIASAAKDPHARQARHDLASAVIAKFRLL